MTNFSYLIITIILGLIVGSFLNVVILRFDDLKSVLVGRSHCPKCKKTLSWFELIPVISYIALQGKCRNCKKTISVQYPLVEAGTALIFALIYLFFGLTLNSLFLTLTSCFLIVMFAYDIINLEISDWLVVGAAALWIIYLLVSVFMFHAPYSILLNSLYGALALGGFLGLIVLVSREKWMGAGDISLGALIGLVLGWPLVMVGGFLGFFIGAVVGVILMLFKTFKLKDQIPFAPFLILGMFVALFWGEQILSWYMGRFI